eukprot:1161539-Pelagomonas_calceolata.AAC.8
MHHKVPSAHLPFIPCSTAAGPGPLITATEAEGSSLTCCPCPFGGRAGGRTGGRVPPGGEATKPCDCCCCCCCDWWSYIEGFAAPGGAVKAPGVAAGKRWPGTGVSRACGVLEASSSGMRCSKDSSRMAWERLERPFKRCK